MKKILRLEISHCSECPFSRRGNPRPMATVTTPTICGQTGKVCYWEFSVDDNKAEFFPSHCPLPNATLSEPIKALIAAFDLLANACDSGNPMEIGKAQIKGRSMISSATFNLVE